MTTPRQEPPIDPTEIYTLLKGLPVIGRSDGSVQIGLDPPAAVLLQDAPPHAVGILRSLDGTAPLAAVLARYRADARLWTDLLHGVRSAGLLVPGGQWTFPGLSGGPPFEPERDSLVLRHGIETARLVLQARRDAVVVVRGSGLVATAVATALLAAGVGHVHQQADRVLRLAEQPAGVPPPDAATARTPLTPGSADRRPRSPHTELRPESAPPLPSRPDVGSGAAVKAAGAVLTAHLARVAPDARVRAPAAHLRVTLTVLAGDGPPAPSLAAELIGRRLPHLSVRAGLVHAVVGPLVLPGRSSCLLCALRHRTELDSGRAEVEQGMRRDVLVPPAQLVAAASMLAVNEALDHLDGLTVPTTVDGTVEWRIGSLVPRRRSWSVHPDCGCARAPGTTSARW